MRTFIACVLLAAGHGPAASAQQTGWIASWAASPAPPQGTEPGIRADLLAPVLENQTLVQVVRLTAGGQALRVRFTNEYSVEPLSIRTARISVVDDAGRAGPSSEITFAGSASITVPARAPIVSDPVALKTEAFARLRIALYLDGKPTCTCHTFGLQHVELSPPGDFTDKPFISLAPATAAYRAFVSEIDVETRKRPVIVALGDSITDGVGSTMDADRRWPDLLAKRLAARGGASPAVINAGIGGNRLMTGTPSGFKGESALARLDRDVLAVPGVTHVILLEGINDIGGGGSTPPSAEMLIIGYRQIIARARSRGIKVIGATITPFLKTPYYIAVGEPVRRQVNDWIRTGGAFDGVIDFDAAIRDSETPQQIKTTLHSGDWLHPNDAGYRAMAEAIDLHLFR